MLGLFAFLALSVLNSPKTRIAIHETLLMAPEAAFYRLDLRVLYSVVIGRDFLLCKQCCEHTKNIVIVIVYFNKRG